jgi:hypothetical protein
VAARVMTPPPSPNARIVGGCDEEELFGPVAAIISVKDEEEHIAAERIESGCVFVNEARALRPATPLRRRRNKFDRLMVRK